MAKKHNKRVTAIIKALHKCAWYAELPMGPYRAYPWGDVACRVHLSESGDKALLTFDDVIIVREEADTIALYEAGDERSPLSALVDHIRETTRWPSNTVSEKKIEILESLLGLRKPVREMKEV